VDAKFGYFLSSVDVTRSDGPVLSLNIQDVAERNVIASFFLGLSVSSPITCVQLNLAMITVHFNYAKRRLDILKLLPCRTDELDAVN